MQPTQPQGPARVRVGLVFRRVRGAVNTHPPALLAGQKPPRVLSLWQLQSSLRARAIGAAQLIGGGCGLCGRPLDASSLAPGAVVCRGCLECPARCTCSPLAEVAAHE
jgi:hypothetical protein